jgi:hypothetical protein
MIWMFSPYGDRVRADVGRWVHSRSDRVRDDFRSLCRRNLKEIVAIELDDRIGSSGVSRLYEAGGDVELSTGGRGRTE